MAFIRAIAEKVTVLRSLQLVTLTSSVRAEYRVRSERGALIYRLEPEVARATGLRPGDVIVAVNNTRVRSAEQAGQLLERLGARQAFRLYFERDGQILFTDLAFR